MFLTFGSWRLKLFNINNTFTSRRNLITNLAVRSTKLILCSTPVKVSPEDKASSYLTNKAKIFCVSFVNKNEELILHWLIWRYDSWKERKHCRFCVFVYFCFTCNRWNWSVLDGIMDRFLFAIMFVWFIHQQCGFFLV